MKKSILFMVTSMHTGGIEMSLISLLEVLDYTKYHVDLLCVKKNGDLRNRIPKNVCVYALPENETDYFESTKKKKQNILVKCRMLYGSFIQRLGGKGIVACGAWDIYEKYISQWGKNYDVAIAYADGFCREYVANKVHAKKKIVWQHFDYRWFNKYQKMDEQTYAKFDKIISVSEMCRKSLLEVFPKLKNRMEVVYNIINEERILRLAKEKPDEKFIIETNIFKICTVGRLVEQKNISFAIDVMKELQLRKINCIWFVIGDGPQCQKLERKIIQAGLENNFYLLGKKNNPYKYMNVADVYVQPSIYEGMSVAITEAKFLRKYILTTDIPTFEEQLEEQYRIPCDVQIFADRLEKLAKKNEKLEVSHQLKYAESVKKIEGILDEEAI